MGSAGQSPLPRPAVAGLVEALAAAGEGALAKFFRPAEEKRPQFATGRGL
jgi:hypothetical protein